MKPRQAAALGLVGWYLMIPPIYHDRVAFQVDENAPLAKWVVYSAHDNADDCEESRVKGNDLAAEKRKQLRDSKSARLLQDQLQFSQCIATDDPRLKPK
jgi:hypothetical protein